MFRFSLVGLWVALILTSAALAAGLRWASFPAATLLGPLLAGMVFALAGAEQGARKYRYLLSWPDQSRPVRHLTIRAWISGFI